MPTKPFSLTRNQHLTPLSPSIISNKCPPQLPNSKQSLEPNLNVEPCLPTKIGTDLKIDQPSELKHSSTTDPLHSSGPKLTVDPATGNPLSTPPTKSFPHSPKASSKLPFRCTRRSKHNQPIQSTTNNARTSRLRHVLAKVRDPNP